MIVVIIHLPGGHVDDSSLGKLFFSSVPSSNSLGLGINLDKYFASGWNFIEKKDTLRFSILGGRRTLSKTSYSNLDCAFL